MRMMSPNNTYRIIEKKLAIRKLIDKTLCLPPQAYLPIGAPNMSAAWNMDKPNKITQASIAIDSIILK